MCAIGAVKVISLDWCFHTGKQLGGRCIANICNEDGNLIATKVTKGTSIMEFEPMLR